VTTGACRPSEILPRSHAIRKPIRLGATIPHPKKRGAGAWRALRRDPEAVQLIGPCADRQSH
jgi:hypothetical protein